MSFLVSGVKSRTQRISDVDNTKFSLHTKQKQLLQKNTIPSLKTIHTKQRIYNKEHRFACSLCEKRFKYKWTMERHKLSHTNEVQNSKCFTQIQELEGDLQAVHTNEYSYQCTRCIKSFKYRQNLVKHMQNQHNECAHCNKCFIRKRDLKNHQVVHAKKHPFKCTLCGKCFKQRYQLTIHHLIHTNERPFICTHCGNSFKQRCVLIQHKAVHTDELAFECSHCGIRFKHKRSITKHQRKSCKGGLPKECVH